MRRPAIGSNQTENHSVLRILGLCAFLTLQLAALPAQQMNRTQDGQPSQPPPSQFVHTCALCHGSDGKGTDRAPTMVNSAHIRGMSDADIATIITKGKNRMPAFPLPQPDVDRLVHYIRELNQTASGAAVAGDAKLGEAIFFAAGECSSCHLARGRGVSRGPDLSNIASRMRLADMQQVLADPNANVTKPRCCAPDAGWQAASAARQ
jgi:mono/diheme cytochrome c family protein